MSETYHTLICEECGTDVPESDAYTKSYAGYDGTVTLAFCPDCTEEPYV